MTQHGDNGGIVLKNGCRSDDGGSSRIESLQPGDYKLQIERNLRPKLLDGLPGAVFSWIGAMKGPGEFELSDLPVGRFGMSFFTDSNDPLSRNLKVVVHDGLTARLVVRSLGDLPVAGIPLGWVLRRVNYNGLEVDPYAIQIDRSRSEHLFEVLLSPAQNGISGEVHLDANPAEGARVLALLEPIGAEAASRRMLQVRSGPVGRFSLDTLNP